MKDRQDKVSSKADCKDKAARLFGYKGFAQAFFNADKGELDNIYDKAFEIYALACLGKAAEKATTEYSHTEGYNHDVHVVDKASITDPNNLV